MTQGYTKGPWRVEDDCIRAKAPEGGEITVALVRGWEVKYKSEEDNNRRLIAAAPELLEALKEAECHLDPTIDCFGLPPLEITLKKLRAALAKAGAA